MLAAQTELAERAARLRQQELVAEVVKPAEAEAERIRLLALAEAERMKIQAEAAASHDRVALDRMLIDQLPQIVKEASAGLAHANVNVLNGADGLGEIAAGLVGQGLTILDTVSRIWAPPATERLPSGPHRPRPAPRSSAPARTTARSRFPEPGQRRPRRRDGPRPATARRTAAVGIHTGPTAPGAGPSATTQQQPESRRPPLPRPPPTTPPASVRLFRDARLRAASSSSAG